MIEDGAIGALTSRLLRVWPEHEKFVARSFEGRSPAALRVSEQLSSCILRLEDSEAALDQLCSDYRFLCEDIVLPEEMFFRRHGHYRLSSFDEANKECYANAEFMDRYMNGLLLSDVLWVNHANAFTHFVEDFLPRLSPGSSHLEIGPGHGMFLYFAAVDQRVSEVTGWDVSPTSIEKTRAALTKLDVKTKPQLRLQNMFDAEPRQNDRPFDSVVMSEILEHLEDPGAALTAAARFMRADGLIFVNVPANSPAPDHIFLFNDLDHIAGIVKEAGFDVVDATAFPMVGATLQQAARQQLSVSCVVTGRKL